jgi:hypothetical protein
VLVEPGPQDGPCFSPQWGDPLFTALSVAADVGAGSELDCRAGEPGEFADTQAGFESEQEQGVVSPPDPGRAVRGCQQGGCFFLSQVGD